MRTIRSMYFNHLVSFYIINHEELSHIKIFTSTASFSTAALYSFVLIYHIYLNNLQILDRSFVPSFSLFLSNTAVMVCTWVGNEFPDMRQNEGRIKFIRGGDTVKTAGWLKGESNPFTS